MAIVSAGHNVTPNGQKQFGALLQKKKNQKQNLLVLTGFILKTSTRLLKVIFKVTQSVFLRSLI